MKILNFPREFSRRSLARSERTYRRVSAGVQGSVLSPRGRSRLRPASRLTRSVTTDRRGNGTERTNRTARRSRENSHGANARVCDTATANHLYAFLVLLSYNVSLDAYLPCYCGYTSVVYVLSMRVAVLGVLVLPPPCLSRRRRLRRRRGCRDETTRRRGAFVR